MRQIDSMIVKAVTNNREKDVREAVERLPSHLLAIRRST
jgi:hypothetical protein